MIRKIYLVIRCYKDKDNRDLMTTTLIKNSYRETDVSSKIVNFSLFESHFLYLTTIQTRTTKINYFCFCGYYLLHLNFLHVLFVSPQQKHLFHGNKPKKSVQPSKSNMKDSGSQNFWICGGISSSGIISMNILDSTIDTGKEAL